VGNNFLKPFSPTGISKNPLAIFDLFLLLISPLAILMFVVGVIVILDRTGTQQSFLRRLEQTGVVAQAVVDRVDPDWIVVRLTDQAGNEPRIGLIKPVYYPHEVVSALKPGDLVSVRYTNPEFESQAVLNDHLADVQNYWGFLWEPAIMMLIAWVVIVRWPYLLFWGFIEDGGADRREGGAR
jgi:hypothetical protein